MATYIEFPSREGCRSIFDAIDLNGDGSLTLKEIRKALRSNKTLKSQIAQSPPLAPLLQPRLFHETSEALDENRDGWITFDEFTRFCAEVTFRKNVEGEAIILAKLLPQEMKRSQLPVEIYREERALDFILNQSKLLEPLVSPLAFQKGMLMFGEFAMSKGIFVVLLGWVLMFL